MCRQLVSVEPISGRYILGTYTNYFNSASSAPCLCTYIGTCVNIPTAVIVKYPSVDVCLIAYTLCTVVDPIIIYHILFVPINYNNI